MKNIIYFIIPVVAFVLILSNAFFGHLLFDTPYDQDINKYSIYVHLQQEWDSYPGNILFEITNVWSNPNPDKQEYSEDTSDISALTIYNSNQLQYQNEKSYVELKHEFSNCESSWKPMLYRYAIDSVRNKIELIQNIKINDDPYISILPAIPVEKQIVSSSYVQFIPLCTSKENTSYEYSILIDDKNAWFDVYFVPSKDQLDNYLNSDTFYYYPDDTCFANSFQSFTGVCNNVGKNSGLLIVIPDILDKSLTKVKVSLHEII
ncbi:hypothetical protein BD31_I1326 [Candidatus Nitrosopumilus salaria BD31]|uniref:Uncharacterized protein n=1 Tax=Candidatus Nitrosopumilus salarius BD31 TaxID=859350 RepID=I3D1E4_9ARCH|nr:hypothetical protein [Candidatus Nitrosopumilus salaria]EIJ65537.1 hypothetical protein BD31_I1326 [Candidatus Nitrosopumilus salaria BD31]